MAELNGRHNGAAVALTHQDEAIMDLYRIRRELKLLVRDAEADVSWQEQLGSALVRRGQAARERITRQKEIHEKELAAISKQLAKNRDDLAGIIKALQAGEQDVERVLAKLEGIEGRIAEAVAQVLALPDVPLAKVRRRSAGPAIVSLGHRSAPAKVRMN